MKRQRNLILYVSYNREPLETLEIRCPKCHPPTLKSKSFASPTASVILISFHAIFLLLISIHEIRSLPTLQLRSAVQGIPPPLTPPPPLSSLCRAFSPREMFTKERNNAFYFHHATITRTYVHKSRLPSSPPRGFPFAPDDPSSARFINFWQGCEGETSSG